MKGLRSEQTEKLLAYAEKAISENTSLTAVFEKFAAETGRAKGGVRNLYYGLIKSAEKDETLIKKYPALSRLKAHKGKEFTQSEEEELFRLITLGVKKGKSARRTIRELSGGDEKIALRYQNKYRNMLKKKGLTRSRVYFDDEKYNEIRRSIDELFAKVLRSSEAAKKAVQKENEELKRKLAAVTSGESGAKEFFVTVGGEENARS